MARAGAADTHQKKKRKKSSGNKPSTSETLEDPNSGEAASGDLKTPHAATELPHGCKAKAVGEQLEGSMLARSAAQPVAQASMSAGDARGVEADGLPTSTEVEDVRRKQKRPQREGENHLTASQLGLADASQSLSVPLSSKVQPSKSGTLSVQHSPHSNFLACKYAVDRVVVWVIAC